MNNKQQTIGKIVFFGDSEYSNIVLDKLNSTNFKPDLVIGKNTNYSLLVTCYDIGIVASYGRIIPQKVIDKFKYGILNIHPSVLPKYRGPSPLQETIINDDKITGVSIIKMVQRVDAGPIVMQKEFKITKKYTTTELGNVLFSIGADLLINILEKKLYLKNGTEQNNNKATFTKLINKQDAKINWNEAPEIIEQKIRAFNPWPISFTYVKLKTNQNSKILRIQILEAKIENNELKIKKVKPEGKREMSWDNFLRGYAFQGFMD